MDGFLSAQIETLGILSLKKNKKASHCCEAFNPALPAGLEPATL